jgi:hypothetical protein
MNLSRLKVVFLAITLIFCMANSARAYDCSYAISSYNSAVNDISYTLKRYANCVSNSQGKDDCSSEFRRLKSAQADLESAVSTISYSCE